ncbi:alpha-1,6-glucosidase domain-containing protein [Roseateles sp. L2-2]|uniref:alpha-1,6-glucosidase domain-containing protein n=1 Tax=Roseateles sp. L2-2 TaxID=3422597 RepID=UPI003D35B8A2
MGVRSTLSPAWPLLAAWMLSGVAGMPLAMAAVDPSLAACDVGPVTVLTPQASTLATPTVTATATATATSAAPQPVWLDARRLRWPGLSLVAGEVVRWHHSTSGGLALVDGRVSGSDRSLTLRTVDATREPLSAETAAQAAYLGAGAEFALEADVDPATMPRGQALIAVEDAQGRVLRWSPSQTARALDAIFAAAEAETALGVTVTTKGAAFKLWAPTADRVELCAYDGPDSAARARLPLSRDDRTGIWSVDTASGPAVSAASGATAVRSGAYYRYLVELFVPGVGRVRNLVTDPYSVSLSADSARSYVADLSEPRLQPRGWSSSRIPDRVKTPTDMVVYELHVRDFSRDDRSVPAAQRGKYLAFTQSGSAGMRHLRALSRAGLTDVHLLPVFDLATVPERGCVIPSVPKAAPGSDAQQAAVMAVADKDCFNWGYDPFHYSAPEGSFASDANDGAVRVRELRAMVMGLHAAGLRVGMDVVYNHTTASGQHPHSVLDRIVPGYYQRLDALGRVERSTCCDNTATEHRMMGKLLVDSVVLWAREYKIASFRFDLMGHQPRAVMEQLQARLKRELGREVQLIGEGWNFGEVANGARFVQASQLSLNGTGIGTFSDRGRDAVRGGAAGDDAATSARRPGFIVPADAAVDGRAGNAARREELLRQGDLLKLAMAGTLRGFELETVDGRRVAGDKLPYGDQPAGYASVPAEVVNYVENHDNQTLFDALVLKLPRHTSADDRARTQAVALGINALSQGVAYFHAGGELLRSKSMDRNSYDSGDWFNRLDWTGRDNGFGAGLPPARDSGSDYALLRPLLADAAIKPGPAQIDWTRRVFLDQLRIRASTPLFRLADPEEIRRRLVFHNTGPDQQAGVIVGRLDGAGRADAVFERVLYVVNASAGEAALTLPAEAGFAWRLHPVQRAAGAADARVRTEARIDAAQGAFRVPARSVAVFVVERR